MQNIRLLLIEDNEGDLFLMTEVIHNMGVSNISIKKDGKAAVDFLQTTMEVPSLIFLDINLPKLNGFEVLEFIRSNKSTVNIPVVIFSTSSSIRDVILAYKNDASCFITKQANFNDFQSTLSSCITFWTRFNPRLSQ